MQYYVNNMENKKENQIISLFLCILIIIGENHPNNFESLCNHLIP